jgi:broad specificity phosphatase PhoE
MPHLYLVRHGQPDFTGDYDSLTNLGAQQSSWLGEHWRARGLRFARVASGTLLRQVQTCDVMMQHLPDAPGPIRDARFNEYDHAALLCFFAGDRLQALRAAGDRRGYFTAIRECLYQWSRHEGPAPGCESWGEFGGRIREGVEALCAGLPREANVLVVTSGGVIGRYASDVMGAGVDAAIQLNLQTRNTGVTEVAHSPRTSRLVAFNAIPHLEVAGREEAVTYS